MKTFIIDKSDNHNLNEFRGSWKSKFKKIASDLKYTIGKDNNNNVWASIVAEIKEKRREQNKQRSESTASSSSSGSNRILTPAEKALVLELYSKIEEKDKGTLSIGEKISDCMYDLARDSVFEHPVHSYIFNTSDPVHSYIFDTSDPVWKTYFTSKELKEAKNYNSKLVMNIPEELQTLLSSFENKEYTTASHYYDRALEYCKCIF